MVIPKENSEQGYALLEYKNVSHGWIEPTLSTYQKFSLGLTKESFFSPLISD